MGDKLEAAKSEFNKMLAMGIIRPSKSAWSSPLHVVPRPNGSWRPCGDYRRLNLATADDRYSLPHIQSFTSHPIITPFGLYEFLRMPCRLKSSAQAFQRLMDGVLRGLDFVFVYLDDILVASPNPDKHLQDLRAVLQRLTSNGLSINRDKCRFGQTSVTFLGHQVSGCLLYTSPSPRDLSTSRMPSSA